MTTPSASQPSTNPSSNPSTKEYARAERAELADLLATLSPEQWNAPSLCEGWRVRDVVAHLIGWDALGWPATIVQFARGGFSLNRANEVGLARDAKREPEELLALVRAHLTPRGITAAFGGMIALVDGTIHQQDIRRPLGLTRQIPAERLRHTLELAFKARPIGAKERAEGLRLIATDLDWTHGEGPVVEGAGESLLLALAGRRGVVDELSGAGQPTLASRIPAQGATGL